MSDSRDTDDSNPFQSPTQVSESSVAVPAGAVDRDTVKQFRQQIHGLGAFWIVMGCMASGFGVMIFELFDPRPGIAGESELSVLVLAVLSCVGFAWITLGVLACLKHLWAVYVGLVMTYLSLVAQILSLNLCPIVILILVILQTHRVLTLAKRLRAAGIPLTAKPEQFSGAGPLQVPDGPVAGIGRLPEDD